MGFFSNIIGRAVETVGGAVTSVADKTVLLKTIDLPNNWGTMKIYPVAYRIYLNRGAVDVLTGNEAEQVKAVATQIADAISLAGGKIGLIAQIVKVYIEAEWFAIKLAANGDGVTLRGSYIPVSPIIVPTPGNS